MRDWMVLCHDLKRTNRMMVEGEKCIYFFFKPKSAKEMESRGWSSEVCLSVLEVLSGFLGKKKKKASHTFSSFSQVALPLCKNRKSVVWGKRVKISVDLLGCRTNKKK